MTKLPIKKITTTALFTAMGIVIPIIFHSVYMFGNIFLPMHFPVFICAMLVGPFYGVICALLSVLLSSFLTGMPPLYPVAAIMVFELITYALVAGFVTRIMPKKIPKILNYSISLIISMLFGRVVMGGLSVILIGIIGNGYSFDAFITSAFVTALPGIIIQIIIIPWLTLFLSKLKLLNSY